MRKVDEGEFYNSKLENNFQEFKLFKAEQYYSFEKSPSPEEVSSFSESFSSQKNNIKDNNASNNDTLDKLNKKLEETNSSSGSESSSSSTSTSSSSSSSTSTGTSVSPTSSSVISTSSTSVAAVGASSAGIATVAVASVAAVVIMGGVLVDIKPYIETTKGSDYVILTVDAEKIKEANEVNNSIETENYYINIENKQSIKLQKGKNKYLITGLEPDMSYKYSIDCPDLKLGGTSSVYSDTFKTNKNVDVVGVYDERNCSIIFDESSKNATYSFSLYLSDYEKQYENVSLYLTYEAIDNNLNIQNYIALYDVMEEDNFFRNNVVDIHYKDLYLYMFGDKVDGTSSRDLLFSHHVEIDYPSHWEVEEYPVFEVVPNSERDISNPTQVKLIGDYINYDSTYDLKCRVTLFDENDIVLVQNDDSSLQIGTSSYSFLVDAPYGIKTYQYVIYTLDKNNNEIILYSSPSIAYTASQDYQANYTKVAPIDASITYYSDHVDINVDTNFTSEYENFEYRLEVVNSKNEVCGYYQGRGIASITVNDTVSLDEINFIYYDIGHFINNDITYNDTTIKGGKFGFNIIQVNEGTQEDASTISQIISQGEFSYLNNTYDLKCHITLSISDSDAITTQTKEATIEIVGNTYQISVDAVYGVQSYEYVIYMLDANEQEVVLYTSESLAYSPSQAYQASYTKVAPIDASITYYSDHVDINVDTNFTSEYENFEYRLEVVNSRNKVCGYYQGRGTASITITDIVSLDEINFIYYDIGHIANQEITYNSYLKSGGKYGFNIIRVNEGTQEDASTSTELVSLGELSYYDSNLASSLQARVTINISGKDGMSTEEIETRLYIEGTTYQFMIDAKYGITSYKYIIFMKDANEQDVVLYTSPTISYTASQDYQATYNKVEPSGASITYYNSYVDIEVDVGYTSTYGNLGYRLEVVNSRNEVCGYYQGKDIATITINEPSKLDVLKFIYYDIGYFASEEITYASYPSSTSSEFCLPSINLASNLEFDGVYFTISYEISLIDSYSMESFDLIVNDGTNDYIKNIPYPDKIGIITLDNIEGEKGNVGITLKLKFKDNQSDGLTHMLSSEVVSCDMSYQFEVREVVADLSTNGTTLPIDMFFSYTLPRTYSISIKDSANSVDITTPLTENYYFDSIDKENDINLTVQPLDANGDPVLEVTNIHISKADALMIKEASSYTVNSTNPGDSLITYNDDGTINIYRNTAFTCDDSRLSYNAFIYSSSSTNESGKEIFENGYNSVESNGYSIIENVPALTYSFHYYVYLNYENVKYIVSMDWPSGTVYTPDSIGTYELNSSGGETTITINLTEYGYLDNRIVVNGMEYEFTSYTSMTDSTASLTISDEPITSVKVYFAINSVSEYDNYRLDISVQGNKFKEYTMPINISA